jgi:antiviral helicase SKI2
MAFSIRPVHILSLRLDRQTNLQTKRVCISHPGVWESCSTDLLDIPLDAIPPRWPPVIRGSTKDWTYELAAVPVTSISLVTKYTVKVRVLSPGSLPNRVAHKPSQVDAEAIADRRRRSHMDEALEGVRGILDQISSGRPIPETDWSKIRDIDFRESIQQRDSLQSRLDGLDCQTYGNDFDELVRTSPFPSMSIRTVDLRRSFKRSTPKKSYGARYQSRLFSFLRVWHGCSTGFVSLRLAISDQNLELLPDYEQRIEVLQKLEFIDDKSTVLLKGRVACEVSSAIP